MKNNIKKILSLILITVIIATALVSCKKESSDIHHRLDGIEFTLPKSMRMNAAVTAYDYYFDNLDSSVIFTATKIDAEFLKENKLEEDATLREYVTARTKDMDAEKIYLQYDEQRKAYSYRYNYLFENASSETFIYVVVIGDEVNMWHIEMYCDYESSADMLSAFEVWTSSISTFQK
jgi:hypothetical protein